MDLYHKMLNITGNSPELSVEMAISETKDALKYLNYERMCLVYSSYLYNFLLKKHLLVRIIDTLDLGLTYQHYFLLIKTTENYYLCDLTFPQFNSPELASLNNHGYISCDAEIFNRYLEIVTKQKTNLSIDEVFLGNNKLGR